MLAFVNKLYQKPKHSHPKPPNFRNHKVAYLRYLHNTHFWRWIRFSTIGFVMMLIGFGVLYIAVSRLGLKPVLGYLIENGIMLQIGFLLNRRLTFSDRDTHWFKSLMKWYGVRAGTFATGQGIFFLLVNIFGLEYMLASLTIAMTLGFTGYVISNFFTFAGRLKPVRLTVQ